MLGERFSFSSQAGFGRARSIGHVQNEKCWSLRAQPGLDGWTPGWTDGYGAGGRVSKYLASQGRKGLVWGKEHKPEHRLEGSRGFPEMDFDSETS